MPVSVMSFSGPLHIPLAGLGDSFVHQLCQGLDLGDDAILQCSRGRRQLAEALC